MNAKKILALVLALVLCLGTLAACDSTPAETTAPPAQSTTAPPAESTTAPTETTEAAPLTNAERYPIDFDGTLKAVTTLVDTEGKYNFEMMEELTGVDIEWKSIAVEQAPLYLLDSATIPDMMWGGITTAQIREYGRAGVLVNFMDYLDQMPNLAARYAENPMLFSAVKDADGAVYSLPRYNTSLGSGNNFIMIRTDMAKEAGIDIENLPTTVEGFLELCETLQTYYADVQGYIPFLAGYPSWITYNSNVPDFFFPAFGELMEPELTTTLDGKTVAAGFATEQFKHYLEFMHTMYAEGYLDPECFTREDTAYKAMTVDGLATMCTSLTHMIADNFESGEIEFEVYPALTSQYQSEQRSLKLKAYGDTGFMISSKCSDLDAALSFADALYSVREDPLNEEGTAWGISLWIGLENTDFTMDLEANTYEVLAHEGYDTTSTWLGAAGTSPVMWHDWPYYLADGSALQKKCEGRMMLNEVGYDLTYISYLILTEDEQDIYNDAWNDINLKVTEMHAAFITGQADIETEWDNYIKALYDMGLQDVIDVYQAALDRFNAV